jgi:hypothetical protein
VIAKGDELLSIDIKEALTEYLPKICHIHFSGSFKKYLDESTS